MQRILRRVQVAEHEPRCLPGGAEQKGHPVRLLGQVDGDAALGFGGLDLRPELVLQHLAGEQDGPAH